MYHLHIWTLGFQSTIKVLNIPVYWTPDFHGNSFASHNKFCLCTSFWCQPFQDSPNPLPNNGLISTVTFCTSISDDKCSHYSDVLPLSLLMYFSWPPICWTLMKDEAGHSHIFTSVFHCLLIMWRPSAALSSNPHISTRLSMRHHPVSNYNKTIVTIPSCLS